MELLRKVLEITVLGIFGGCLFGLLGVLARDIPAVRTLVIILLLFVSSIGTAVAIASDNKTAAVIVACFVVLSFIAGVL